MFLCRVHRHGKFTSDKHYDSERKYGYEQNRKAPRIIIISSSFRDDFEDFDEKKNIKI